MSTFSRQHELPHLPVPELKDSFRKYLASVRPYLNDDQVSVVEQEIIEALDDKDMQRRQADLKSLALKEDSWLSDLWFKGCYLSWRAALPINSNVTGYLFGEYRKKWDQCYSAAAVTRGALQYHLDLQAGRVPINMNNKDSPLCMDQYTRMFGFTRIPGQVVDTVQKHDDSKHIVVIAGQRQYVVLVLDEKNLIINSLQSTLSAILLDSASRCKETNPVSVLTGTDRTEWFTTRQSMLNDAQNARCLELIESSLFVVSLEDGIDITDEECATSCFHGNGRTTWFDKSFQLKFKQDGNCSIHIEHSWADAPTPLDMFFNHALPYAESLDESQGKATPETVDSDWSLLTWNISPELKAKITQAESDVDTLIANSDVKLHRCVGLGKAVWKQARLSPDAAVQMAIQLAYRRMSGSEEPVATYETIGMTNWLKGRTECCKVVSEESEAFVRSAMQGPVSDHDGLERLLRAACDSHIAYIVDGQQGRAFDR